MNSKIHGNNNYLLSLFLFFIFLIVTNNEGRCNSFTGYESSFSGPVINVSGNSNNINDGSTLISTTINTDFGTTSSCNAITQAYTIQNNGDQLLTINNIILSGSNALDFSISGIIFPADIIAGTSINFIVSFSPLLTGIRSAVIHIDNNDILNYDFDYAIQGNGSVPLIGNYPSTTIHTNENSVVTPSVPPSGINYIMASASIGFEGLITVDPVSGDVKITNAKPAGNYVVTVSDNTCAKKNFNLIVSTQNCNTGIFNVSDISVGNGPRSVAIGDFNSDGKQDIAVVNGGASTVSIMLGNGIGGFSLSSTLNVGNTPFSAAIGDFNGDGRQDIVVTNVSSNNFSLLMANGLGGFILTGDFTVGTNPYYLVVGDFNSDNKLDVATANYASNNVSIRLGDGAGGFSNSVNIPTGTNPSAIAVGDFNIDGKKDLAVTNYTSNTVSIFLGNGTGNFAQSAVVNVQSHPYSIEVADFNGDNKQDLAVANNGSSSVSIRMGDGSGQFTGTTNVAAGSGCSSVTVGDFNGDGKLDIAATNLSANTISELIGNGSGGFSLFSTVSTGSNSGPILIKSGEFKGDGTADLITCNLNANKISILLGVKKEIKLTGNNITILDGSISTSTTNNTNFGSESLCNVSFKTYSIQNPGLSPLQINSISISGVNASEFLVAGITLPVTLSPNGSINFTLQHNPAGLGISSATIHINNNSCDAEDFDFAVQSNVVVPSIGTYPVTNTFTGKNLTITPTVPPIGVSYLNISATNGFEGILTIDPLTGIVSVTDAGPVGIYTINVFLGTCISQSFLLTVTNSGCNQIDYSSPLIIGSVLNPRSITIGDFNEDGFQDLATASETSNNVAITLGSGSGSFGILSSFSAGTSPFSIAVGDFNKDGNQDLVTANALSNNVSILNGNGSGAFTLQGNFSVGLKPYFIIVGDFNNDTNQDLVTANYDGNNVSLILGNGQGNFGAPINFFAGTNPASLAKGDFNNDGKLDLVVSNFGSSTVTILLGDGIGGFSHNGTVTVGNSPYSIAIGDFNADGKSDMAVANNISNTVSVRMGDGLGGFSGSVNLNSGNGTSCVVTQDFNLDGNLDILATNLNSNTISFFTGDGMGGFNLFSNVTSASAGPIMITDGEFNGDGGLDFAIACLNGDKISIVSGTGQEIDVLANGILIPDESINISSAINTDFGSVSTCGMTSTRLFTVQNNGISPLTINNINLIGADASSFIITGVFPAIIQPGTASTFTISFVPSTAGIKNATIKIFNTDCDESEYNFEIQGTAVTTIPTLGSYADVTTISGSNLTISPTSAPTNINFLDVTAPNNFLGIVTVDPSTGAVSITDSKPAGNFIIKVSASNCVTKSFLLTVSNLNCNLPSYSSPSVIGSALGPRSIAIGDFNHDQFQDMAVASEGLNDVSIRLGNGAGGFSSLTTIGVGMSPFSIAVGDFNKDGNQDLVTANAISNNVSILLGNGAGAFGAVNNYNTGSKPYFVIVGDFNGDKNQDLVTANFNSNNVSILTGDGHGNFSSPVNFSVGTNPTSLSTGDFNNDGNLDIAATNYGQTTVSILLGNGNGGISATSSATVGTRPNSIAMSDFNGDGKLDMAVANNFSNTISIRIGNGLGAFTGTTNLSAGSGTSYVTARDFNLDGKIDLVAANLNGNSLSFYTGNGTGSFSLFSTVNLGSGSGPIMVTSGEFNGDGVADYAVANLNANNFSLLIGKIGEIDLSANGISIADGSTNILSSNNTDFGTISTCNSVKKNFTIQNTGQGSLIINGITLTGINAADFIVAGLTFPVTIAPGGSGIFEVKFIASTAGVKSATMHINNNDCNEADYDIAIQGSSNGLIPTLGTYNNVTVFAGGSFNNPVSNAPSGSLVLDVAAPPNFQGTLNIDQVNGNVRITDAYPAGSYLIKVSTGSCVLQTFTLTVNNVNCTSDGYNSQYLSGTISTPRGIEVGDFNKDGNQDLAFTSEGSGNVTISLGNGNGVFGSFTSFSVGSNPFSIALGDFNKDGNQDLVTANVASNNISILSGNGSGAFSLFGNLNTGTQPYFVIVGDFNDDKNQDLATANYASNNVSIFLGDGLGNFNSPVNFSVGVNPTSIAAGDFNNDGKQDLAVTNFGTTNVSILLGNGIGGFSSNGIVTVGNKPYFIAVNDFNADGNLDMAVANNTSNTISIRLGNGLGGFSGTTNLSAGSGTSSIAVRDFNLDGFLDLVATDIYDKTVYFYTGNSTGGFTLYTIVTDATDTGPYMITSGEFNSDGIPDFAVTDLHASTVSILIDAKPEINIQANSISIPDGSTTISSTINTDFVTIPVCNINSKKSFTIQNLGNGALTINSISFTGTGASNFTVSGISFPYTVAMGASVNFEISFMPSFSGVKLAIVHINNNDCNESDYDISIRGIGSSSVPTLGVYQNVTTINGGNITVIPNAPPGGGASFFNVTTATNFLGIITVDPVTGNVLITDANPAGVYPVTITMGSCITRTFNLTVNNAVCTQGGFSQISAVAPITRSRAVDIGDFNKDGFQDMAITSELLSTVSIKLGSASGSFTSHQEIAVGFIPFSIAIGDFNKDGKQDIVTSNRGDNTVTVLLGNGTGTFSILGNFSTGNSPYAVVVGDFNGDKNQDLATANNISNTVSILLGDGLGSFSAATHFPVGTKPISLSTGDFNNDGKLDLAATSSTSNDVAVLLGNGIGGFSSNGNVAVGTWPISIVTQDLNNDNKLDMIVSNYHSNSVSIRFGDGLGGFTGSTSINRC
jgi:hypothetical protein